MTDPAQIATTALIPNSTASPIGQASHGTESRVLKRVQPVLAPTRCVKQQVGDDDGENRPGERLASREDQHQESERNGEQQTVGNGTVTQALQRLRTKAARRHHVIEIQCRPPDERERREDDSPAAVQHQRQDQRRLMNP